MKEFDLIVLGGGSGAFAAAIKANSLRANTLLVNDGLPLGGTCVNVGCVPSKTLIKAAELLYQARNHTFRGIRFALEDFDFAAVVEDELRLVDDLRREKYEEVLSELQHVQFMSGRARFASAHEIEVNGERVSGKSFIVATGSTAVIPNLPDLAALTRERDYVTHIEVLRRKELPQRLVVIGGGPIGLEFGQLFRHFGSEVTLLQRAPRLLPRAESVLSDEIGRYLTDEGMKILLNASVVNIVKDGETKRVEFEVEGKTQTVDADLILFAAGKHPNTTGLDLKAAGISLNEQGYITVDDSMQTSARHVYAIGDVNDKPLRLETTAAKEGSIAAENAMQGTSRTVTYHDVPYAVFTTPEVAAVGLTEAEYLERYKVCACRTVPFSLIPKAHVERDTRGVIKMVIDPKSQKIVGVHVVAHQAADLIHEATLAVKFGLTIDNIIDTVHVFPTLSESLKTVAQSFRQDVSKLSCCTE